MMMMMMMREMMKVVDFGVDSGVYSKRDIVTITRNNKKGLINNSSSSNSIVNFIKGNHNTYNIYIKCLSPSKNTN